MAAVAALSVVAGLTTAVAPAQAALGHPAGPVDSSGFPAYYTDVAGTSLQPCLTGPNCPAVVGGEAFYYQAFANIPVSGGTVMVILALEKAFLAGSRVTFDRLRVRGDMPAGNYTLEHPYGETLPMPSAAKGNKPSAINFTQDAICGATSTIPCDFDFATRGLITNFLTASVPTPPPGFLGDSTTPSTVTGATATEADGVTPRNKLVLKNSLGTIVGQTDKFLITGQVMDGPEASLTPPTAIEFGNTALTTRTLTVKNIGTQPLDLGLPTLGAPSSSLRSFVVTSDTCSAAPIPLGESCAIGLTYASAGADANATATLTMTTNRLPLGAVATIPISVPLHATSLPAASVTGGPLAFGASKVGTASAKTVTLANTGVAPMTVGTATATGPFTASQTCGASLAVGANCTVSATYTATVLGAESGILTILHPGTSGGSTSVALTGSGTTPNLALSNASLEFGDVQPGAVSPQKTVRLTNTGDAVMVVGAASVTGPFAIESSDCPATLPPAGFCNVAVTFRPAGIGDATGTLTLPSDVPGGAAQVALHGASSVVAPPPVVVPPTKPATRSTVSGAPRIGAATGGKRGGTVTAKIRWKPPLRNGGSSITRYKVSIRRVGRATVVTRNMSARARSLTVKRLVTNARYRFYVKAVNARGTSRRSAMSRTVVAR